jgi:hypothetical protein
MSKRYIAKIVYDIVPLEDGLLEWQDEDETPMTHEELIRYARSEMFEIITNGVKYDDLWNMIDVEVVDA